jgi:aryl-alcohol dehydrogenase-like predicted oxidoreductase
MMLRDFVASEIKQEVYLCNIENWDVQVGSIRPERLMGHCNTWDRAEDLNHSGLNRAIELGVNFFDTADGYGDGHSEQLLAQLRRQHKESIHIATKAGRRLDPHIASGYNRENLTAFVERSLKNLDTEALDLLQLHCPPTQVYYMPEVFGILDDLVKAGKVRYYGVSVEKVEEALKAIEYPNVQSVQIIFNMFRHRPAELLFEQAIKRKVGILARVRAGISECLRAN